MSDKWVKLASKELTWKYASIWLLFSFVAIVADALVFYLGIRLFSDLLELGIIMIPLALLLPMAFFHERHCIRRLVSKDYDDPTIEQIRQFVLTETSIIIKGSDDMVLTEHDLDRLTKISKTRSTIILEFNKYSMVVLPRNDQMELVLTPFCKGKHK